MIPRICVVAPLYHPALGGLGRQAQLLSERLHREGVDLFVISRQMAGMPPANFSPDVEVVRLAVLFPEIYILEEISLRNILVSLSFSAGLAATLVSRRKRYEIAHFHGASIPLFVSLPFLRLMKKKVVAKVAAAKLGTEAGGLSGRFGIFGDLLARWVRKVDAFVAISEEIREGLLRDGIEEDRIHRIANFVDQETFHPPSQWEKDVLKEKLGFPGKTLVLYAGRLVPRKGVESLLAAWIGIPDRFPSAMLVILGDGPLEGSLREMANRLGVASTVRFLGRVDNVPEFLRASDIFVLPSLQEGLPNSLLEAMACGLPSVATRIGGVTDVARDGEDALLVEPGDATDLREKLELLLRSETVRDGLGRSALNTIRESYGIESRIPHYMRIYDALM